MPTQRYTQAARRRDERIFELLLSGFSPEQVASQVELSVGEVLAARCRIQEAHGAKGPEEAANRRALIMFDAIYMQSMQAWQRSTLPVEVITPPPAGAAADQPAERKIIHPIGDGRHLDRALRALVAERKLRESWTPQPDPPAADAPEAANPPAASVPAASAPAAQEAAILSALSDEPLPIPFSRGKTPAPRQRDVIADVCSRAFSERASLAGEIGKT